MAAISLQIVFESARCRKANTRLHSFADGSGTDIWVALARRLRTFDLFGAIASIWEAGHDSAVTIDADLEFPRNDSEAVAAAQGKVFACAPA